MVVPTAGSLANVGIFMFAVGHRARADYSAACSLHDSSHCSSSNILSYQYSGLQSGMRAIISEGLFYFRSASPTFSGVKRHKQRIDGTEGAA